MVALVTLVLLSQAWSEVSQTDGVKLEARAVKDSAFYEYRATAKTDATVETLCDTVFEWGSMSKDHENLITRKLLEDNGDTRIVYDQFDPPVVSKRDLTFSVHRAHDGDKCSITFLSANDKAPPKVDGWVRLEKLKGSWLFEPAEGGTRVTYMLFAEPGGSIPPVFVHGSQRDRTVKTLQKGISLARTKTDNAGHRH